MPSSTSTSRGPSPEPDPALPPASPTFADPGHWKRSLSSRAGRYAGGGSRGHRVATVVAEVGDLDRAVYAAVSSITTANLDDALRRLSKTADHSKIWFGVAAAAATFGGRRGREAAFDGVVAIGLTSFVVNQPLKRLLPRERPDRERHGVVEQRHVPLPTSPSFPSGHAASAFAFANAVGGELPWLALPLRGLAAAVAWSRVHTGVHYPGDVIIGGLIGGAVGEVVGTVRRRLDARRARTG